MSYILVIMMLLAIVAAPAFADKVLDPNAGFINNLINADTLSNGKRADSVYVLQRGATYFVQGYIENIGYPLVLKAETGSGSMPRVVAYPQADGSLGARLLNASNDCYLYNIYFDGMGPNADTGVPDPLVRMGGQLLRAAAPGKVLVVDGCILNNCGQVTIRSNSGARLIKVTNTVIANMGQVSADNLGNGRFIDFRDGATDSLIVRNCTLINGCDRVIRHRDASKKQNFVQYMEFDHCTFMHWLGAFGMFHVGDIGAAGLKMTNNLFINPMAFGFSTTDQWRRAEFDLHGEVDAAANPMMYEISDEPNEGITPKFEIHHNVFYTEQAIKDVWANHGVVEAPVLSKRIRGLMGADSAQAYVNAEVTLKNAPKFMYALYNWYYANPIEIAASTTAEYDMDRHTRDFWSDSLDCSYATSNPAFVGSDRLPVGDTNWNSTITGVEQNGVNPEQFSLGQNYPNPFNPMTVIHYTLEARGKVMLRIYDISGHEVATLVNTVQPAGRYQAIFNGRNLPSGTYFYELSQSGSRMVKKMALIK